MFVFRFGFRDPPQHPHARKMQRVKKNRINRIYPSVFAPLKKGVRLTMIPTTIVTGIEIWRF
jgi:hypothetical protein